ncbi:MAG: TonB family protein [Hyalangium sp.]|uniref:AgmX/PglI C-terminal domain-containing protein n=1 Tax=Hyalangium sp. TaxID=2028555 RepID=UPI00389A4750
MLHTAVTALLALSLSSTPFVPTGSPTKNKPPPPVEHPKPPPPPQDKPPEHDRPDHDRPHPDHSDRGPYYHQNGSEYREDPALEIIRRNMPQVDGCFGRIHLQAPSLQGTVTVEWDIDIDGRVQRAQVVGNTTGDTELGNCILLAVKGWQFRNGDVTYPGHMSHAFQLQASP